MMSINIERNTLRGTVLTHGVFNKVTFSEREAYWPPHEMAIFWSKL